MFIAFEIAISTPRGQNYTTPGILGRLFIILLVHTFAVARSVRFRAQMIVRHRYFREPGRNLESYMLIFLKCWITASLWYIVLNSYFLSAELVPSQTPSWVILIYIGRNLLWSVIPASCGAMVAYAIDRPAETFRDRVISSSVLGITMGIVAILSVLCIDNLPDLPGALDRLRADTLGGKIFYAVLFGGLGAVLGFGLPTELKRYWRTLDEETGKIMFEGLSGASAEAAGRGVMADFELTRQVQLNLNRLGATLCADGIYGPDTKAAVETFQAAHGLKVDGWAGPVTIQAIEAAAQAM